MEKLESEAKLLEERQDVVPKIEVVQQYFKEINIFEVNEMS